MPKYHVPVVRDLPPEGTPRRRVVFVTNQNSGTIDYMGTMQVFHEASFFAKDSGRPDLGYDVEVVSRGTGAIFERKGLTISADASYSHLRGDVDTLIFHAPDDEDACLRDPRFIAWVGRMATRVRRVVSVCTGSFVLAEAGVLDGRRATTHWAAAADFQRRYPDVDLEPDAIYVKDGHVYTAGGSTSGMDLAIALVEEDLGTDCARRVAQGLVMFLRRPGTQTQFSVQVGLDASDTSDLGEMERYIFEHLDGDLRIEALAEQFGMSPRTFNRVFRREVGVAPGRFVEQCRLELARQLLEETTESVSGIAERCGYDSSHGLRLAFERNLSVTPRAYRERFSSPVAVPG